MNSYLDIIVYLFTSVSICLTSVSSQNCGYKSCNPVKDGMLNIHIIPHTHDDVGWVKTYEEYYRQDVRKIISSVVDNLERDRMVGGDKRFIYVEMAFLKLWWMEQDNTTKQTVKDLVHEGRLEIILGGWCMNDEATPYYLDIIDQHTLGFQFIRENLGECGRPKIGWQIDPFGHSREVASLFAQFGFDGMFVGRIDYQDKRARQRIKTMEMVWKTSDSLGESSSNLFLGVLENVYWPPKGFCWDYWCSDPELVNSSEEYKRAKVDEFIRIMKEEAHHYATNHVMVEMGSDFQYRWADKWYQNLDELIRLINERQKEDMTFNINALYSTPSCYLNQLHRTNRTWTLKENDFFPFAHREHSFWTGYFTSRPHLKRLVRTAGNILQSCKQLNAFADLDDTDDDINNLKEAMAVVQHHDGVSGTEKQYVAEDYTRLLHNGINYCRRVMYASLAKLLGFNNTHIFRDLDHCDHLSHEACKVTEKTDQFSVILYNPLAREHEHFVRLPVVVGEYEVKDSSGRLVQHQLLPITEQTKNIPERPSSDADSVLIFKSNLPGLGIQVFSVQEKEQTIDHKDEDILEEDLIDLAEELQEVEPYEEAIEIIENKYYTLTVDRHTGLVSRLLNKEDDIAVSLEQNFFYYISHDGYNSNGDDQASGAYIFRPKYNTPEHVSKKSHITIVKGKLVQEIRQVFSSWVSQVIRIYKDQPYIEFEWTVGPLPAGAGREGKEIITKYMTDLETEGELYTDLNGRETLKRRRDERDSWELDQTEPVSGNYYPITSRAAIKDERRDIQLTVLVDRSEGAASIQDGNLEIMVHRRTFYDDSLGVQEPLTEYGASGKGIVVRGKHYVMLNNISGAASVYRPLYHVIYHQPFIAFSSNKDVTALPIQEWSGVNLDLPRNVYLLTLDVWKKPVVETQHTALLLRLEHTFERFEDTDLSGPVTVNIQNMFKTITVVDMIELSLGANMKLMDMDRFVWKVKNEGHGSGTRKQETKHLEDGFNIELSHMQIRTFQVNVNILT